MSDVAASPIGNESYFLAPEQISAYQRDGHMLLHQVAHPAEIATYQPIIVEVAQRFNTEHRPLEERDTYGKAFLQIMNLWEHDPRVQQFVFAQRFAHIAAELMGVKAVRLYHDQALFKEPGGGPTPWHQDQVYWPLDTDHTITMWMPLVDVPATVGSMTFASGSQRMTYASALEISDASEEAFAHVIAEQGFPMQSYGALQAGDATFHAGWTMHRAPGNPTAQIREVMTVIYFADGAHLLEPDSPARRNDVERWMPGVVPGDTVASRLNPLLYQEQ